MFWNSADTKRLVSWKVLKHFVISNLYFLSLWLYKVWLWILGEWYLLEFTWNRISSLSWKLLPFKKSLNSDLRWTAILKRRHNQFGKFAMTSVLLISQTCYALAATEYEWQWGLVGQGRARLRQQDHLVIVNIIVIIIISSMTSITIIMSKWGLVGQERAHRQPRGHLVIVLSSSFCDCFTININITIASITIIIDFQS